MIKPLRYTMSLLVLLVGTPLLIAQATTGQDSIRQGPTPEEQAKINAAITVMEAVQKAGAYVESIADLIGNQELTLPVGIKKGDYELIIQKIKQNPKTGKANIYATCAFKFKDNGQAIAFEGVADIEGQNGLGTNGSLEIIAPVWRDLGKQASIGFEKGTKIMFGCEGVELVEANMKFAITSDKIYGVTPEGKPTGKPITASFKTKFADFEDYTTSFGINKSFALKGLPDVFFTIHSAALDQSDLETPKLVAFPQNYFSQGNPTAAKLWKGLAITKATLTLPPYFKPPATSDSLVAPGKRIEIGIKNSLFDENGFTAEVLGDGVVPGPLISRTKWDISLDDLALLVLKNEVVGFGFGGSINIPPFGKNSVLGYSAKYNVLSEEYDFLIDVDGEYEFPALNSTLTLNKNSSIELLIRDSEFYPSIVANGSITVNAPINKEDSTKKFSVPDIAFEEMLISREAPHFSVGSIDIAGDLRSPKIGGFEMYIEEIKPFQNEKGSGLGFEAGVKLNEMFGGETGLQLYGNYTNWKFDHLEMSHIRVNYASKSFSVNGGVLFKNGDKTYGSGFRGSLKFRLIDKFTLDAIGVFGKKDDFRYFLTDVFFETQPINGIPAGPLTFYGFGGGLYKRMQQTYDKTLVDTFAQSLSGMRYIPDNNVGMGFMTSTKFALASSATAFNAQLTFEMQFNRYGGVNFIQLRGDGSFMDNPDKWGKLADKINEKTTAATGKLNAGDGKIKVAVKSDLEVPKNKKSGFLTASMNIKYDISNSVFTADLSTYLNAGFLKGVGENDRMGWASAYFSDDKWYTYIGTPTDPLGIKIMGLAESRSYFMIGNEIPELPPPPAKVLKNFSPEKQAELDKRDISQLAPGKGMAFGAGLSIDFEATLPPFYATIGAGLGADFMLKNYGNEAYCAGGSTTLGINGWYAKAQAWAYVEADIGMKANVLKRERKFSILDISAGALLKGAGPNPIYLTGVVGGHFSVMGGLISGQCDFDFEIGEECIMKGGSPFGENIIAQLTPSTGEKDINVFTAPQAVFNIPIGLEMEIEEEEGEKAMYKVTLEQFTVAYKDTRARVEGFTSLSPDGLVYAFDPDEPFESNKELVVTAKVGFKRKLNGNWVDVKDNNGKPVYEEKTETFVSGERPKTILAEHVKYSYPMPRQYNFYPDEYEQGYIQVTENYAYLFSTEKPEGFNQVVRVEDKSGNHWESAFTFKTNGAGKDIRLEIDFPLKDVAFANNEIYQFGIINVPKHKNTDIAGNVSSVTTTDDSMGVSVTTQQAEGTIQVLQEKEVYAHYFRTSKYKTFDEKIAQYDMRGTGWRDYVEPFVHDIKANITDDEYFDRYEMQWADGDFPTVRLEAQLANTDWFKHSIYKNMYANHSGESIKDERQELDPDFNKLGFPPVMGAEIQNPTNDRTLSDGEINTGVPTGTFAYGNFTYSLPYWCARDFYYIKEEIGKKVANQTPLKKWEAEILANDFPPVVEKGDYPLKISYVLPGKDIATSTIDIKMYNPID